MFSALSGVHTEIFAWEGGGVRGPILCFPFPLLPEHTMQYIQCFVGWVFTLPWGVTTPSDYVTKADDKYFLYFRKPCMYNIPLYLAFFSVSDTISE